MKRLMGFILVFLSMILGAQAQAAAWPAKPIHIVVPYGPGGNTDTVARILADGLSKELGQNIVIENRPGATALIGTNYVANAAPDGYTYLLNTISLVISPHIFKSITEELAPKFTPVSQIASISKVLVVNPSLPVSSVAELIDYAKKSDKQLTYGSTGTGSANHLVGELFSMYTSLPLTHVPYKGSSPAINDLIGNEISMIFEDLPPAVPFITGGRLKALLVASPQRNPALPNIPSAGELGLNELIVEPWNGVLAPAGVSPTTIATMDQAIKKVVESTEYQTRLKSAGAQPTYRNATDYHQFIQAESTRWGEIIKKAGIPKQ